MFRYVFPFVSLFYGIRDARLIVQARQQQLANQLSMLSFTEGSSHSALWSLLTAVVSLLGASELVKALYRLSKGLFVYFLRPSKNIKKYGPWAVVTGATDGIGRAYADALAKRGLNLVLISRTQAKLETGQQEIKQKYRVQVQTLAVDFGKLDTAALTAIHDAVRRVDVGLLVNNVGISYDHAEYLDAIDDQLIDDLVQINVVAATKLAKLVLPGMKQRKQPSAVINIGSAAATVAPSGPLYAVYAGTKAYIDMFSKSLDLEYRQYGISVHNQAPMYVATKMSKIRRARLDAPSPKVWAESAIRHIGYESTSCPYWVHGIMWGVANSLPVWVMDTYLMSMHTDLRNRYLRKKAREAKTA